MSDGAGKAAERAEAARLLGAFLDAGATLAEADILQPAETLLDLYGEDIRARAFTTQGLAGEAMLRPDFTVPIVQLHMARGGDPARYAYAGEVFRRQETAPERPSEYIQVGFELFGGDDPALADAEVFALFSDLLAPLGLRVGTGDIGILTAAVGALSVSERRRAALLRHIWRPRRFRALMERFSSTLRLDPPVPGAAEAPEIGLRSRAEVEERLAMLARAAAEPPIPSEQVWLLDQILSLDAPAPEALSRLRDAATDLPGLEPAVDRLDARLGALDAAGVAVETLPFSGSHGRSTMEYYDGFVFSFSRPGRPDLPPVATGGRYDALTRKLGEGRAVPAIGGVIRPAATLAAAAAASGRA
ncbi:ATP phosphoribosyltransferase regulatory subunit [Palleronia sediminis]|uniref:ATP phosphoribosyltransferase regulatory subunit n=1 Tax=Palleronia sediminis TaxID=2547833 RepID=A0A4V3BA07_9RHOB|nr:ATP phosphoribosyltransferase regulatory subunit [Palleronia sediminis]TDL81369.1 ATP phosphoribosyltransferase regulatory subunit [Palleronia sediminis]